MPKPNTLERNVSLKPYNTFGIDVTALQFMEIDDNATLKEVLFSKEHPDSLIIGGGSNILLTKDLERLVIHLNTKGIEVLNKTQNHAQVEIQAGEVWHDFVLWALVHDLGGIENLSLIPGNVGTAPVQNIGAYGVELKDVFVSCQALDLKENKQVSFTKEDCAFGYRDSVFKRNKGRYIITSVILELTTRNHQKNISYGAIASQLKEQGIEHPSINQISDAVISIRQSKLPDPKVLGNGGSFFKNPVVLVEQFTQIQKQYPDIPHYNFGENQIKIPAGWLIEQCGYKGKRYKEVGVHKNQALVLVNYGDAKGEQLWELAQNIQKSVKDKFNVYIEPEVNIY
ncbi:UDP-N-acetylenolpyruvoylglucosamine reductase [Galbibacter marinus]|uniref:UDP-N-acetylenolpyruvoylglucosamine reductase n=1 Tax=Galbibacter marinus TaxID=555500 RepID=K2PTK9_9FLAO|nr:UDP-N-acetylmuramate dehydrogenase [Galbibacter marinus]EKF55895.1 UDP-N-acetylenolpyruvoylglucosamine reductase [Galbibacter marinus]